MDVNIRSQGENFTYDPQINGYDTQFWKTLSGVPAISSTVLRFTSAEVASYSFYRGGVYRFKLTVPVAPTAAQDKSWGFKTPSLGNVSRVEFDITGAVFSVVVYDKDGNTAFSQAITWDAAWTATAVVYEMRILDGGITFWINNTRKAAYMFNAVANRKKIYDAGPLHIKNLNADNLDLTYLSAREVQSLT